MSNYKISKEIIKRIEKEEHYSTDNFIEDVKRYIKTCDENRIICNIESVSPSGMSRVLKFMEFSFDTTIKRAYILNFYMLFRVLGYEKARNSDGYRVHGCGMDMVFNTNYVNIHEFKSMGFLRKKRCDTLAQNTPQCV